MQSNYCMKSLLPGSLKFQKPEVLELLRLNRLKKKGFWDNLKYIYYYGYTKEVLI